MVIPDFTFACTPHTLYGAGLFSNLDELISSIASKVLIITGAHSLRKSGRLDALERSLKSRSVKYYNISLCGEPTPKFVDDSVAKFKNENIGVVVAIGGGSVIDAGKAVSGMLTQEDSVKNYLEGVGNKTHNGEKIPFIAVPTTAGTGSEATKNAVLSQVGENGFKKSLRHDNLVPNIALIDPELAVTCPPDVTAACGMDAFTQLLESYVSPKASPMTDSLSYNGIAHMKDNLIKVCTTESDNVNIRGAMAYASYISGITLANAGLGIVHGLASPIGGFFNVPHGVVCGTLIGAATRMNIRCLLDSGQKGQLALRKFEQIGKLLSGSESNTAKENRNNLIETIDEWTEKLNMPKLSKYGIKLSHIPGLVEATGIKNNPVQLENYQIEEILKERV